MKDLLPDNVTARENAQPQSPNQPRQREIKSVLTWISAFITYTAILTEAFPARTKELLAYMRVILREARRSKDNGWLSYDRIFRQNAVTNPLVSWANLDPSLHASFCSQSALSAMMLITPRKSAPPAQKKPLPIPALLPRFLPGQPSRNGRFACHGTQANAYSPEPASSCHNHRARKRRQTRCSSAREGECSQGTIVNVMHR